MRGKTRCQDWRENRPDSNTEPLRSLVQFVISRDILRHSPRDYYHFLVSPPPCQCFHFLLAQHARSTERVLPVRKYGNRAEKRARLPRIVLIRPRLQQFPNFRIVSNFLANFPLAKNSSRFLRRKIRGREKRPRRGKSFESRVDFDPRVVVSFVFDYVVLVAWRKHLVRSVSSFFLTCTLRYVSISISSNVIRIFDMDFEYSMEI